MSTSGTVAQTRVTVDALLTQAVKRTGKLFSTVGGELLSDVRLALYMLIADLGNDGVNLWCINKTVSNVAPGQLSFQLVSATNDVVNALYRTLNSVPGSFTSTPDSLVFTANAPFAPHNVTFTFVNDSQSFLVLEYWDGAIWVNQASLSSLFIPAGADFVMDLENTVPAAQWRIRDSNGTIVEMSNVMFRTVNTEITMSRLNRDDYINLPNKHSAGAKSLQYWFDKQVNPRVWVWPVSNSVTHDQIVFWTASEVQDPGDLSNELAVPTRWYQAIVDTLSVRTAMLIPPSELLPGRLDALRMDAARSMARALDGESDGSSFQISPRIGGYTK